MKEYWDANSIDYKLTRTNRIFFFKKKGKMVNWKEKVFVRKKAKSKNIRMLTSLTISQYLDSSSPLSMVQVAVTPSRSMVSPSAFAAGPAS